VCITEAGEQSPEHWMVSNVGCYRVRQVDEQYLFTRSELNNFLVNFKKLRLIIS